MLYDIKNLDKKRLVDEGNQEALYELAEHYIMTLGRADLGYEYHAKIIENECQCKPIHYVDAMLFVAAWKMDEEKFSEALELYQRAKQFMEKEIPEEHWILRVYENIGNAKKIILLKKRIEKGDQEALYEFATSWANQNFAVEDEVLAAKYYRQLISQECQIDKHKFIDAYVFVGWYESQNGELEKALETYKEAKEFMESNIPEEEWELSVYENLITTKNNLLKK